MVHLYMQSTRPNFNFLGIVKVLEWQKFRITEIQIIQAFAWRLSRDLNILIGLAKFELHEFELDRADYTYLGCMLDFELSRARERALSCFLGSGL